MILLQKITGSARGGDPYDVPDYTLYRKGWEIGDGVHIATGNYTKSFTDLSVTSPGVTSDFVRTYNSMSDEEGSFRYWLGFQYRCEQDCNAGYRVTIR